MKGSASTPHPLRQQSHHPHQQAQQPQQPQPPQPGLMPPTGAGGNENASLTPMVPTAIKQEGSSSDLMVPGQTHLGSPDTVSQCHMSHVDSTTYPSRLTPPEPNEIFTLQEELLNGNLPGQSADKKDIFLIKNEINPISNSKSIWKYPKKKSG